jgi:NAD(P)-dependent dehydrogenase (short-subunit alcohol dehydrogenase family)
MPRMIPPSPACVLTGAASGLGRAFALELASRNARVFLADIDDAGLAETAKMVTERGGTARTLHCDVAKLDDVKQLHGDALAWLSGVDLLINNAGVGVSGNVGDIPIEDWQWITGINQWGVVYGCHLFLPDMKKRRSGHVLNVASIATNIAKNGRSRSSAVSPDAIDKIMKRTPVQAAEVAKLALRACDKGHLYVFPHREAKVIATMKRLIPETFLTKLGPHAAKVAPK